MFAYLCHEMGNVTGLNWSKRRYLTCTEQTTMWRQVLEHYPCITYTPSQHTKPRTDAHTRTHIHAHRHRYQPSIIHTDFWQCQWQIQDMV